MNENCVVSFSPDPTKHPARVRKYRNTGRPGITAKAMFARDGSRGAGSKARGEGRERGNLIDLIETTFKPPGSPEGWWGSVRQLKKVGVRARRPTMRMFENRLCGTGVAVAAFDISSVVADAKL